MPTVKVRVFGTAKEEIRISLVEVASEITLETFLISWIGGDDSARALAGKTVLLNGQSVVKKTWNASRLEDGDVISIIPMLVGG